MPYATDGSIPRDTTGFPVGSVYVPGTGTVGMQGGTVATDSTGEPYAPGIIQLTNSSISLLDGSRPTYSATISALASAASCTDLFTITGSATKTVRVTRLEISGEASTAVSVQIVLLVRSTANLTGTSTTPTVVPHDSNSAAGTAVVRAYTVNPGTLGTLVGNIRNDFLFLSAPATATVGAEKLFLDFGVGSTQALVLRGASQVLAVNLAAATITGGSFDINLTWSEDNS
jgi:hypothetical protein